MHHNISLFEPANIVKMLITMPLDIWFPLLTFFFIASITWIFMSNRSKTHPPLPPGPTGLPVVGMLPFMDPQLHTYFADLSKIHGPLMSMRIGKKTIIVVSSPLVAKQVLKDFDINFANHDVPVAGRELTYGGKDITFTPYGPELRMLRKVSANGILGPAALDVTCNIRRQWLKETILYLHENTGSPINIGEQLFVMVLNVITSMLWGETMKGTDTANEGAEFRRVVNMSLELVGLPNVTDFFPGLARFDLQGIVKRMRDYTKRIDRIIEAAIDEQRKKDSRKSGESTSVEDSKDFLQFLLQLKDRNDPKTQLSMAQLKALLLDMILAGTDTTSNTLEFAMAEIMNKPEVMRKAQQELDEVVGANNQVEESHIQQLPYLHAIMKETLRLRPVVPLLVPRCSSESCIVGGYTIPKGSAVFFNVWAIQRDPSVWEDPLEFKPERFLDGKYDFRGTEFSYFPFGSGRRICPGRALSERMILLFLASLLHYFDWKLPQGVEKLDLSVKFGFTMSKVTPLLLIPFPRSSSNLQEESAI